ncbi:MAG: Sapep family Mn(2+)-dependent dipeptidase [Oscillospiraceae bacterium]|nr:Sapep family Mn(2+)-dependent dipeptidase [Oscillospiraceae bacterium]
MKQKITDFIYAHREQMVDVIRQLVEIPSVKGAPQPGAPFGAEPKRALDKMLEISREMGFVTKCCDNVVGTADYSPTGTIGLGILGHLDVVPAEPLNWSYPPFELTRTDGRLLGRGVIDDKGPCAAALFALWCVKELGIPLKKGVRLLFGTDEENGSGDLEIYCRGNKLPPMVFTPDASFPVINIEKGMIRADITGEYSEGSVVSFRGGSIPNAVPDKAEAVLRGISYEEVYAVITSNFTGAVLTADTAENGDITISCAGRSAHASTPRAGINAVTALISVLNMLPLREGQQREIFRGLEDVFPFGETDGRSASLRIGDEKSGELTLTFSKFAMQDGKISGCIDIRYPVSAQLEDVVNRLSAALEHAGVHYGKNIEEQPHCVPEDSEFVQKLLKVYSEVEGEPGRCIAIGGGTYVHDIEGGVAFGVERGDTDYHMHGNDEFITEDELLRDAVLFACAIADICG